MCCCSLKTVVVTLWGSSAEGVGRELEEQAEAAPVVAISACRVSSYNGVSGETQPLSLHRNLCNRKLRCVLGHPACGTCADSPQQGLTSAPAALAWPLWSCLPLAQLIHRL